MLTVWWVAINVTVNTVHKSTHSGILAFVLKLSACALISPGRLTSDQIKAGYAALKKIDYCVDQKDYGPRLMEACNDFYTRIPHYFGYVINMMSMSVLFLFQHISFHLFYSPFFIVPRDKTSL